MFSFSGKSTKSEKKSINVNLTTFWQSLDDNYFTASTAITLQSKYSEIMQNISPPQIYTKTKHGEDVDEKVKKRTTDSTTEQHVEEKKGNYKLNYALRKVHLVVFM